MAYHKYRRTYSKGNSLYRANFTEERKYITKSYNRQLHELTAFEPIANIVQPIMNIWSGGRAYQSSKWHRAANTSLGFGHCFSIYLSAQDSISSLMTLFECVMVHYDIVKTEDYPDNHKRIYTFKCDFTDIEFPIYVYFKRSISCKSVGTGEFKEITKVECIYE